MTIFYIDFFKSVDLLHKKGVALDLGSGQGHGTIELRKLGYKVLAVDKRPEWDGFKPDIVSDIRVFKIKPSTYDIIVCNNVLPFIKKKKEVKKILEDIARGLKKGGVAYFSLYGKHSHYYGRSDMSFFSYMAAQKMVEGLPHTFVFHKISKEGYSNDMKNLIRYHDVFRFYITKGVKIKKHPPSSSIHKQ